MSFTDSIEVRQELFTIKTSINQENGFDFVYVDIIKDDKLIWKDRILFPKKSELSLDEYMAVVHSNTLKDFKGTLDAVSKNIDFELLNNTINDFKKRIGRGLSLVEVLAKDSLFVISNYNANKHASRLFIDLYNKFSNKLKFQNNKLQYYFLMLSGNRGVIVGKIENTELIYGLIVNLNDTPMGVIVNILLPKFVKNINKILIG